MQSFIWIKMEQNVPGDGPVIMKMKKIKESEKYSKYTNKYQSVAERKKKQVLN